MRSENYSEPYGGREMTDEAHKRNTFPKTDVTFETSPRISLNDLVLNSLTEDAVHQLIEEQKYQNLLRNHSFEPRNRMLLSGFAGNGQKFFAEAIAEELNVPFYTVLFDTLLKISFEEAKKILNDIFNSVQQYNCVLFFDGFNSVGNERCDEYNDAIKRVASYLLMKLEQLPSWVIAIVATNHAELLDRAILRHFQFCLDFPDPSASSEQFKTFIEKTMNEWTEKPRKSVREIANNLLLYKINYAEALDFLQNVRRRQILSSGEVTFDFAFEMELALLKNKAKNLANYDSDLD